MECTTVGEPDPDIAGLGVFVGMAVQAGLSVLLSTWLFIRDRTISRYPILPASRPSEIEALRQLIDGISDSQILAGVSLLIAAFVTRDTLSLYHYRVIYDISSFTAVSVCASIIHTKGVGFDEDAGRWTLPSAGTTMRLIMATVYGILHLGFSILFGTMLKSWEWDVDGRCYNTNLVSHPSASHPYVDLIYLGVTCSYMQLMLMATVIAGCMDFDWGFKDEPDAEPWEVMMFGQFLLLAFVQYPIHLWSTVSLRLANESYFDDTSENEWSFGQIIPLIFVLDTLMKCTSACYDVFYPRKPPRSSRYTESVEDARSIQDQSMQDPQMEEPRRIATM
ncbi:hypothetical protein B0T26DRAFT_528429 [Lasiosphaeria miniovina]|uniref:Uncharacterized protein n=1 Tax=Lasiosphaeria miniovina TaxID=1954250 RepID=A0AA39ZQD2_9PEZI|nr:uncharacterized protein B0T26DRAFT_528429 [Lasiosphaeria miniovina]KAK0701727.1 hypothetical protein B0T26DRAFT_528429 [Lasiosphaeria miniovina]